MAAFLLATASQGSTPDQCHSLAPTTAAFFTYEDMGTYKKVISTQCDTTYILYPRGETAPDLGSDFQYFGVPLQNVAVTQTVTNTFLEALGVRDQMLVASPRPAAC